MKSESNEQLASGRDEQAMVSDVKNDNMDDVDDDGDDDKPDAPLTRQDLFVCFTNDKDLRHHETISIKASLYKGIAVRVKILNHIWIENILFSIETAKDQGIVNLRFEECRLLKKAVLRLIEFCKTTSIIESLSLSKTSFDDGQDFKRLVEAVSYNQKIRTFSVNHAVFDEDFHGKMMARCVLESRSIKELDLSFVTFEDHKSFYEMANGLLHERCRLGALKLKGIAFNQLEGKVMQFILMRNKSLQTLDLSQCSTDSPENLEYVFLKFDQFCNIRTLVAENLDADFNYFVESFGDALGLNTKLEGLSLKENKLKQAQYCNFWALMAPNRSLKKINVSKTEVTDKVCTKISAYLREPDLRLHDINLSRNQIAADGLIALAEALSENTSLLTINLAQNFIREGGIIEFVQALKVNRTLKELCLSLNKINNPGVEALSGFLSSNSTLEVLDLSKNIFSDTGFVQFARELGKNSGIQSLNLSKNKDISDEVGLRELAYALSTNSSLAIIDLTGLKIRKPCVIQYFQPALKQNITLKRIIGKLPPGIISDDLKDNITIESDVSLKYKVLKKENRRELNKLPLHRVDGDHTLLNLRNQGNDLLTPALKFIRYRKVMGVDISNMQLEDESLRLMAQYLEENPILRSLALAENFFTDDGLSQIIKALRGNTNLNHLNIESCNQISNISLRELEDMVTQVNMSLYSIELDTNAGYDNSLVERIQNQAKWNKAIQEHLKPKKVTNAEGLVEIKFDSDAGIAKHFDAAIKAWRILGPSMIRAVNEGLDDDHVEQLCDFLCNRNLIQSLNLRRNKIGNRGALALADYIRVSDKTLNCIELERNEIQDEGGEALLQAAQSNMRIECCKMSYGNPMRQKICRQIEREIKANLQIKSTVYPRYKANNNSLVHYEESDRGPDFVRCALKSCELFKILHLSLPDNMIGEKEMNDIAYVLQRNTPLKTLNLSENVVDAKAAKVLANALGYNNHLRELDLRNNKLGDAGIAVLIEPFILQKIMKFRKLPEIDNKNKNDHQHMEDELRNPGQKDKKQMLMSATKVKLDEVMKNLCTKKLKMKIDRIQIDNNQQTSEALKHIYTALIANPDIEINIDLPEEPPILTDDSISDEEKEDEDKDELPEIELPLNASPSHTAVAQAPMEKLKLNVKDIPEGEEAKVERHDSVISDPDEKKHPTKEDEDPEDEDLEEKMKIPAICKLNMCRPCRKLCYRDKNKPKKSCAQIFCRSYLISRNRATMFKMSIELLQDSEQGLQKNIFKMIMAQFCLFFICCMVLPFVIRSNECTSIPPIAVFGGYGGFLFFSSMIEIFILMKLKGELKSHGSNSVHCSSYIIVKYLQGQLASLASFLQIAFVASIAACHLQDDGESFHQEMDASIESAQDGSYEGNKIVNSGLGIFLAICSSIVLIGSNYKKVQFISVYLKAQPQIHSIMPNTVRNAQLAWLCNFKMIAVILESTSLTEYMISLGGPVVPGKQRYFSAKREDIAESLTYPIMSDRLKLQDLPMASILVIFLLASLSSASSMEIIIILGYIGIILLQALCCYIAQAWPRNAKHINYQLVSQTITDRLEFHARRRGDGKELEREVEKQSNETDRSNAKSNDLNEVINQLSLLEQSQIPIQGSLEDTQKLQLLNNTNDAEDFTTS